MLCRPHAYPHQQSQMPRFETRQTIIRCKQFRPPIFFDPLVQTSMCQPPVTLGSLTLSFPAPSGPVFQVLHRSLVACAIFPKLPPDIFEEVNLEKEQELRAQDAEHGQGS